MPTVSVVVPAYNRADTIEACLRAVRASTFHDYELIVVDGGSRDGTSAIAHRYADRVMTLRGRPSRSQARNAGVAAAGGEVIVNVDADVVVRPQTLALIVDYFSSHREVDAVTGLLAKEQPHQDFFSQYKNLYMHYVFWQLPDRVTFLYGSIHAFRRRAARPYGAVAQVADDTALGQQLTAEGKRIAFVRDLEVVHLKRYDLWSLLANDFRIPFDWTVVFMSYSGWRQLGRRGTSFAHASTAQLASVMLAPSIVLAGVLALSDPVWFPAVVGLAACWLLLNLRFTAFLAKERGRVFGLLGCLWTFPDHLMMAAGIVCGFVYAMLKATMRRPSHLAP